MDPTKNVPDVADRNKSDIMWETLITTLTDIVHNRSLNLEKILNMIRNDLTYDDPGLFPSLLLANPEERDPIRAFNFWLLNQLVHIASIANYFGIKRSTSELQQTILSASFVKQTWFFYEASLKYLEILEALNTFQPEKQPIQLLAFHMPGTYFERLNCSCSFAVVEVGDKVTKRILTENCLNVLSQVVSIADDRGSPEFRAQCAEVVLNTMNFGCLEEKTLCLMFFGKYLKMISEITPCVERLATEIMGIVETCLERFNRWLSSELTQVKSIEQFKTALMDYYSKLNVIPFLDVPTDHRRNLVLYSIKIIKQVITLKTDNEELKLKLLDQIKKFLSIVLNHSPTVVLGDGFESLYVMIFQFPDLIHLVEAPIINEINATELTSEIIVTKISNIWASVLGYIQKEHQHLKISQKIETVQKLVRLAVDVIHGCYLQKQKSNISQLTINMFDSKLVEILEIIFENVKECQMKKDIFLWIQDTCFDVVNLQEFSTLDETFQKTICSWCFVPFMNSFEHSKLEIPDDTIQVLNDCIQNDSDLRIIQIGTLDQLCKFAVENLCEAAKEMFKDIFWSIIVTIKNSNDSELKRALFRFYQSLLLSMKYPVDQLAKELLFPSLFEPDIQMIACRYLSTHYCIKSQNYQVWQIKGDTTSRKRKFRCLRCQPDNSDENFMCTQLSISSQRTEFTTRQEGFLLTTCSTQKVRCSLSVDELEKLFVIENIETQLAMVNLLPVLLKHVPTVVLNERLVSTWSNLITSHNDEVNIAFAKSFPVLMESLACGSVSPDEKNSIIQTCLNKLSEAVRQSINKPNYNRQSSVMNMVLKFSTSGSADIIHEERLMHCIRMLFFFLMLRESEITREASLIVAEMCEHHGVSTRDMLNWYRHDIIKLMIAISATNYHCHEISLYKSLTHVSKTFQFSGPVEFINKYYKIILAMLLPWCIKRPSCVNLLQELANIIRKEKTMVLSNSFLTIYPYLFINEPANITNQCIDFIMTNTGNTLVRLLHSDIKKTVSEILIFYHINAECVLHAFRSLLAKDGDAEDITTAQMAEYISSRFLGVLTFFEASLINPENERALKRETLLSLGEIIRLLGGHHITPFRFKIIALLKTTLAIDEPNLKSICVKVWRIFICTVDVQQLGPLLSTIFVSLELLIDQFTEDINYIFHYLVIQNNSLLSPHISDLFFLSETKVDEEIKQVVAAHTRNDRDRKEFMFRFTELVKHVNHENLAVRVYGLRFLRQLFADNRSELNDSVIGQLSFNPMVVHLLDNLIKSCSDVDVGYRLRAAECLGELGALAPNYLPPNYAPQESFALSIHSDAFASMALAELCRAYQFQKDTKYVDSFSLAIQEILLERGVSPSNGKKLEVWEAIPDRLRPIMEPLLSSCYTGLDRVSSTECHPIFGSSKAQTCQEWAFLWACQLIEKLEKDQTQNLLKSFKPSIRCDISTMTNFLPYILLHALQSSNEENRKMFVEELQFLFNAILNNNPEIDSPESQDHYIRGLRAMQFVSKDRKPQAPDVPTSDMSMECAKLAFRLLDFLEKWKRQWKKVYQLDDSKVDYHNVEGFLNEFNHEMLANINFKCQEYARSLMYLEAYIEEEPMRFQDHLFFLAKIFTHLNDPDSVEGVICSKTTEPTLAEQILLHNATGRLHQSAACYERMLQLRDISPLDIYNMVECYLRLDQPETALLLSESLLNQYYENDVQSLLQEIKAEPLYRLGRFEALEELLESPGMQESDNWGVICGSLMVGYRKNQHEQFLQKLEQARLAVLRILHNSDLKISAYEKGYEQVLKLHMIDEFEKCEHILENIRSFGIHRCQNDLQNLIANFDARLELLQPNAATAEPIISLRRILLNETKILITELASTNPSAGNIVKEIKDTIDGHIGHLWIKSTELASRAKLFEQAHLYILHAESYKPKELFIKKAQLLWEKRDASNAFKVLERGLGEILERCKVKEVKQLPKEERLIYAQGKLLIAIYNADASNVSASVNQRCFKEAVLAHPESEKSMVHLAQYLDKLYVNYSSDDQDSTRGWELLQDVMTYYGKSMIYGSTYIYQSMPRVLSIWLDFTARSVNNDSYKKICSNMIKLAQKFSESLSPYFFFTAFSQLISRVAHPSVEVYQVLKSIIVKLILNYPQQSLWMLLSVYKSSYANRVKRCHEIFHDKKLSKVTMQKMITDFNALAERFIELTNKELGSSKDTKVMVSSLVKTLPKLFSDGNLSDIVMPIQKCMQLVLDKNSSTFAPYAMNLVYIHGIKEEVTILQSLQKPRKITLIGNDGREYTMMMKPKDDLRKDFRLMEFNAVVKQYLYQDPDAKQRRLNIRTYAVLPLNEECGIIEWVDNLNTFRSIICTYYKQRGLGMPAKELRNYNYKRQDPLQKKRDAFVNCLLPRHPPVFGEWFRDRFSNPHNWFQARSSYIRTTAVISIVGYILGLGDRHGENILFDATNGDTVHVDFNCLFNKGETFEIPELVPFRLTHNMVRAMGPLGVEGLYRKCCEIALRVLQNQTPTLMSVLKPFVYDPLVSWNKISKHDGATERTDPQAMNNVKHIEERLKGYVRINGKMSHMPLSVEGQINHLISEATNQDNLAQMYIGWAGYM
ncbi:serine/threonine-protein kinase ATR-like [Uranotaenia lowii]|uniref:serine/threonine-protein kinase ATR-like n=1 Tax=Uranotaenia lowii TaxID=190385 RepID=UPI0024789137|nr:serine/threonine-protein kinase ATR-like [Uranotaenia lowii]